MLVDVNCVTIMVGAKVYCQYSKGVNEISVYPLIVKNHVSELFDSHVSSMQTVLNS